MSTLACDTINLSTVHDFLKPHSTLTSSGAKVISYIHDTGKEGFDYVLDFVPYRGYRDLLTENVKLTTEKLAPLLKDKISLFIPELPGYGISSAPKDAKGFRAIGGAISEAYQSVFPNRDIILGGHDRGARICHRLAVDHAHPPASKPSFKLIGLIVLDIVPTLRQWQVFADARAATAYFHWPFLASPLAADMIEAYGGDKWVHSALARIGGDNEEARARFQSDRAWEVYESVFTKRSTIEGSCADYYEGAYSEPQMQEADQKAGRKVNVPALVMWSLARLGKMHGDLNPIWAPWIEQGVEFSAVGCGADVGHYLPEEATDQVGPQIVSFIEKHVK